MSKKLLALLFVLLDIIVEAYIAYLWYVGLDPLPDEFYLRTVDCVLRDCVLAGVVGLLFYRRKRVPDRIVRYFPVVVSGLLYLGIAAFMVAQLSLDKGVLTTLSVLAGLNNNIVLVLVAAMCYHHWPSWKMKLTYFAVYMFTSLTMVGDAFYFWQTSMHVESVLFQNLNWYAVEGVLSSMSSTMLGCMAAGFVALIALFRVSEPRKHKPNFTWSLMSLAGVSMAINIIALLLASLGMYGVEEAIGTYVEIENEKTRQEYRRLLTVPMNGNFAVKAMFDTDKLAAKSHVEQRELTKDDLASLAELGISGKRVESGIGAVEDSAQSVKDVQVGKAEYDRVVMLILESVHRDYINYYNNDIPEQATRYLNELIIKYPHMDRYYTSAVPTTQGLNATFRSHVIMDKDIPGRTTPSLFRSVQAAGMRGIFMNASSQYYANELREYPEQYGMKEYYAKEYLEKQGYQGASGWGYHNDVMYQATLDMMEKMKGERYLFVCKTLDMHQPYPVTGITWENTPNPEVRDAPYFTIRGMYWVDRTIKSFFDEAKKRGLMDDRTLFVITSDHNPHSGGEYTKLVTKANDKMSIAPIPLIFVSSNLVPLDSLRTREYSSQIDLAPTLLGLLGLKSPDRFMGRDLLKPCAKPYALGYFGGKAYYWSEERHFVDQMDKPVPDSKYEDALSNYIIREYGLWHK